MSAKLLGGYLNMKAFLPHRKKDYVLSQSDNNISPPKMKCEKVSIKNRILSSSKLPKSLNRIPKLNKSAFLNSLTHKSHEASTCTSTDMSDEDENIITFIEVDQIIEQSSDLECSPPKKSTAKRGLNFSILCENLSKLKSKPENQYYKKYKKEYPTALMHFPPIDPVDIRIYSRRSTPNPRSHCISQHATKAFINSSSKTKFNFNLSTRIYR